MIESRLAVDILPTVPPVIFAVINSIISVEKNTSCLP